MAISFQCQCGRLLRASLETAGKKTRCPGCNQVLTIPGASLVGASVATSSATTGAGASSPSSVIEADPFTLNLDWSTVEAQHPPAPPAASDRPESGLIKIDSVATDSPLLAEVPRTHDGSRQYRVITQKDQGFSGKFNATKLEDMLNAQARHGWTLKSAVTMNIPSHGGHHDELIVILER